MHFQGLNWVSPNFKQPPSECSMICRDLWEDCRWTFISASSTQRNQGRNKLGFKLQPSQISTTMVHVVVGVLMPLLHWVPRHSLNGSLNDRMHFDHLCRTSTNNWDSTCFMQLGVETLFVECKFAKGQARNHAGSSLPNCMKEYRIQCLLIYANVISSLCIFRFICKGLALELSLVQLVNAIWLACKTPSDWRQPGPIWNLDISAACSGEAPRVHSSSAGKIEGPTANHLCRAWHQNQLNMSLTNRKGDYHE